MFSKLLLVIFAIFCNCAADFGIPKSTSTVSPLPIKPLIENGVEVSDDEFDAKYKHQVGILS